MTLENVTDATVKATTFPPSFPVQVKAGDGTTWDTADLMNHSWPFALPTPLAPGESKTVQLQPLAGQFPGPLTVTPTCAGERMLALRSDVTNPGPTPTPEDAVARAVAATSGLFNACPPTPTGSVVGMVSPPDVKGALIATRAVSSSFSASIADFVPAEEAPDAALARVLRRSQPAQRVGSTAAQ